MAQHRTVAAKESVVQRAWFSYGKATHGRVTVTHCCVRQWDSRVGFGKGRAQFCFVKGEQRHAMSRDGEAGRSSGWQLALCGMAGEWRCLAKICKGNAEHGDALLWLCVALRWHGEARIGDGLAREGSAEARFSSVWRRRSKVWHRAGTAMERTGARRLRMALDCEGTASRSIVPFGQWSAKHYMAG